MAMRVVLLGSDRKRIMKATGISADDLDWLETELAKKLVELGEVVFIPEGEPLRIARKCKELGGKTIAVLPSEDKRYGVSHIQTPDFVDEVEYPRRTWYDLNAEITMLGDIVVVIGMSPGVLIELAYTKYLRRYGLADPRIYIFKQTITSIPKELEAEISFRYVESAEEIV